MPFASVIHKRDIGGNHVIGSKINVRFLTEIHKYHRIRKRSNGILSVNKYFIIVYNKTVLKTINMKNIFEQMWHIVEYFIMNLFTFLIVFD